MQPFRVTPLMPPSAYKTYALKLPVQTHFRVATCKEVECEREANGFRTTLDTSQPAHARTAKWIEDHSGRKYTKQETGTLVIYTFPAGQECFNTHHVTLEREPLLIVRGGDWRGNPRGDRRIHARAADWVEDFAEHQDGIAREIEKG